MGEAAAGGHRATRRRPGPALSLLRVSHALLLPPLRRLSEIIATKSHLNESLAPTRLDPLLPGIGRNWASLVGTLSFLYCQLRVYAAQFESLAGRWEQERFDLLQPDSPGLHPILTVLLIEQLKDVSTKEVELVGLSSGSRAAAGALNFAQFHMQHKGGSDSTGAAAEEVET